MVAGGKVTNVLVLDGNAYVIVDGKDKYPLKDVSLKNSGNKDENGTDKTEGTDGPSNTEKDGESTNAPEGTTTTTDSTVTQAETMSSYMAQSDALFSELMSTIDSISGTETKSQSVINNLKPNLDGYETVTVTKLDIPNYAAAYLAQYEDLQDLILPNASYANANDNVTFANLSAGTQNAGYNTLYANTPSNTSSAAASSDTAVTLTAGRYDIPLTTSNLYAVANASRTGQLTPTLSNAQVYSIISDGSYSTRYSAKYGLEAYSDSKPGISNSDCAPHRLDADKYPEQAALADALGTRMYDIKFINNRAITSRIDTSRVIGKTISGREISEIGYCGVGRLGEVVTFKNGKQRVEIMFDNGNSGWLETSGKYTIDQIINEQVGSDVTPFEVSIAYYAKSQSAKKFENLRQNLTSMGVNVVG